jgi:hypothetical protein
MRDEKRKGSRLAVFVLALCLVQVTANLADGGRKVSIPVRPFAVNPDNRHLRFDGIFDITSDKHVIGVFLKNESSTTIFNVTAKASFEPGSGIVPTKDVYEFGTLKPGIPVLGYFEADFHGSTPKKHSLILEVSGDSFTQTVSRKLFVIRSETDPGDTHKWAVQTPEGKISTIIDELYKGADLGSSVAGKSFKWVIEQVPYKGQFSGLPYGDPWWKVIGSIVPGGAGRTVIDSQIGELCDKERGSFIEGIAKSAFTTSLLNVTSDDMGPFRKGQMNTEPDGPDETTIKEEVDVSVDYLKAPVVGKSYTAKVKWIYKRTTNVKTYTYEYEGKVKNIHAAGKPPEVKIKRRVAAGGAEYVITVRTSGSKESSDNYRYFAANLFKTDAGNTEAPVLSVFLRDDGQMGDRTAGDGIFTRVVPADRLPADASIDAFVFGFDINTASESDPPEIAAKNVGGVLVSTPPFKLFDLVPSAVLKTSPIAPQPEKDTADTEKETKGKSKEPKKPKSPEITRIGEKAAGTAGKGVKVVPKILKPLFGFCIGGRVFLDTGTLIKAEETPLNSFSAKDISGSVSGEIKLCLAMKLSKQITFGVSGGFQFPKKGPFPLLFNSFISEPDELGLPVIIEIQEELELSAFAIPVELFLKTSLGNKFFLRWAAGLDFYKASLKNPNRTFEDRGTGRHVSLAAGFPVTKNLALTFDASYVWAKLNEFTDTSGGVDRQLFVSEDDRGIRLVDVKEEEIFSEPVEIDFSGLKLSAGITLCF